MAEERGGIPEDFDNFVTFLRNLRHALSSTSKKYGLSITLPSSYWYLRHFDIQRMEESVDWVCIFYKSPPVEARPATLTIHAMIVQHDEL